MKRIIFISQGFPNVSKTTHLYTDLMHEFLRQGHDVLILAPDEEGGKSYSLVVEHQMNIVRVPIFGLYGKNKILKGISNLLLPYQYKRALKKLKIDLDFDLIIMPTPPITLIDVAFWIKKKSDAKLYLILRDIFPQNAVDLKMMRPNSFIHNYFRKKEITLYQQSDQIGCMSPANVSYVIQHNPKIEANKLHLLPNWESVHEMDRNFNEEEIRKQYGLEDKLIAIFGGNIGLPQRMENIVALAEACTDLDDLVFFIVGRGTERDRIASMVKDKQLKNVIIRASLPRPDYNKILQMADIGLISLNENFTIPNFPSKVTSYYGYKKPVLASVDKHTDFGEIQEEIGAGLWSEAGDTASLKKNLLKLYHSKEIRTRMGEMGHEYMLGHLLPHHAYATIMEAVFPASEKVKAYQKNV
jgi:glycosyltransferase involved in cell wall biosynthesis